MHGSEDLTNALGEEEELERRASLSATSTPSSSINAPGHATFHAFIDFPLIVEAPGAVQVDHVRVEAT